MMFNFIQVNEVFFPADELWDMNCSQNLACWVQNGGLCIVYSYSTSFPQITLQFSSGSDEILTAWQQLPPTPVKHRIWMESCFSTFAFRATLTTWGVRYSLFWIRSKDCKQQYACNRQLIQNCHWNSLHDVLPLVVIFHIEMWRCGLFTESDRHFLTLTTPTPYPHSETQDFDRHSFPLQPHTTNSFVTLFNILFIYIMGLKFDLSGYCIG